MESKSRATVAGVFVMTMILMLIGTVLWFSQDRTVRIEYDIITERSVNGITPQASVELYGLEVGRVKSVSFVGGGSSQVLIRLLVDETAPISQATYATLSSRGVTGAVFVELSDDASGSDGQRGLLTEVTPKGQPLLIPLRAGTLESFTKGASDFFGKADETLNSLNRILSLENEQKLFSTVESFGAAADQVVKLGSTLDVKLGGVLEEVRVVAHQAGQTLENLNGLSLNAGKMMQALGEEGGAFQSITKGTEALSKAAEHLRYVTLPQVDSAAQSVSLTLRAAKRFVEELEDQPQMLILGAGEVEAGPGEKGYQSPYGSK